MIEMLYFIGKIVTTHGIKGEVKVLPNTDFDRFKTGNTVYIDTKELVIRQVRTQNKYYLVAFEGLNSLNDVEFLRGLDVFTKDEPPKLKKDEFHLPQLIGLSVYLMDDELVGVVDDVLDFPQGYYLRVKTKDNKKVLIPFIKEFVKKANDDGVWIDPIEGLI